MKIAVIGSGNVGGSLGRILASKGHAVTFGVRDPHSEKVRSLLDSIPAQTKADPIPVAVAGAEIVILATPWDAAQNALAAAGDLSGKVLIDTTNPVGLNSEGLSRGLVIGHTTSAAEEVAKWAPGASVVKAFNTIGANCFENPQFGSVTATAFICGDDATAKQTVTTLAQDIGFEVVDAGSLSQARLLEPLAMLWISLAFAGVGREFSISLVKR
ncbi:NADPH-dependent F420 reductase [Kovacikia minuta]|uniref:NADPH-dependent F420 reductase n=1 Tax=Kovacikia minuta TaxID=2931930 RepID=UPI0020C750E7|nr:NADPH-dependent F420 reductase [Kovacikia minuta]